MKPKLLVILGPTASGKSALAVELAKQFNGEIISADSRQVYKALDIGTGKITKEEMQGVAHHLLDVADPQDYFSVEEYKKLAENAIKDITSRNKLPILCGGTGFYMSAIVDNISLPQVPPNDEFRNNLETEPVEHIFKKLEELDPDRAATIDPYNKVRIIRALEIATALGKVPAVSTEENYATLQIGLSVSDEQLREKIVTRLNTRLAHGMIEEVQKLHDTGLSWERLNALGLEYRYIAEFLQNKLTKQELTETLVNKIWQYSRRQMTWFKKDKRIKWFGPEEKEKIIAEVTQLV